METIGHFTHLQERQAALLAFSRSRGMSERALSALPQPPCARKAVEIIIVESEVAPVSGKRLPKVARPGRVPAPNPTREQRQRVKIIKAAVALVFAVEPNWFKRGTARQCDARQYAMYLARLDTKLPFRLLSEFFEAQEDTVKRSVRTRERRIKYDRDLQAIDAAVREALR